MPRVTMPQLGESVAEGTIGRWLKQVGDHVAKYEPIVEVITDKVNAEVPSPFEGTLTSILVQEGATVPNGAEIAEIEEAGAGQAAGAAQAPGTAAEVPVPASPKEATADVAQPSREEHGPAGSDERRPDETRPAAAVPGPANGTAPAAAPAATATAEPRTEYGGPVTPAVRRLAREHDVDLALVHGTGHAGRVTREDVMAYVEARTSGGTQAAPAQAAPPAAPAAQPSAPGGPAAVPAAPAAAAAPGAPAVAPAAAMGEGDSLKPMTQMRRGIANQMTKSLAVPMAYVTLEVDMSAAVGLRERMKREYEAREGIGLSFVSIVTKATVEALRRHPDLNAHWTEQGLLRRGRVNVGIAVAVDDGLIVPVIHDADRLSINGLNHTVVDLAARARGGRLRLDELQGGTFTVDNTGWFGSIASQPIVNVPEVMILTMEAIQKRPVVIESADGDAIAIRPMMNICAAFDHRATDGAQAAGFMQDVKRWLESVDAQTAIW